MIQTLKPDMAKHVANCEGGMKWSEKQLYDYFYTSGNSGAVVP